MSSYPEDFIVAANDEHAKTFPKAQAGLALPPGKSYAIITCMDARIDAYSAFGLKPGEAHVIRNAGGNAQDTIRSLIISQQLLNTKAVVLVKHTDCGMVTFTNEDAHATVKKNLGVSAEHIDFQPFPDLRQAVLDDVAFLKSHELIPQEIRDHTTGWIYDVKTGKLERVV